MKVTKKLVGISQDIETKKYTSLRTRVTRAWGLYLLLLFPLVYVFIFNYIPMYGVLMAFQRFTIRDGIWGSTWVGLYHFERFLTSPIALRVIWNTIVLNLYSLAVSFPLPIMLAIGLTHVTSRYYRKSVQMITYAPFFLSSVVLVGLMSQFFGMRFGPINHVITFLGGSPVNFMGSVDAFRHMFVWSGVWQEMGYNSIIFIAALSSVDPQMHEAAVIDGASMWKRILYIDIPTILPTITIILILRMGAMMTVGFERVFLMQNPMNTSVSEVIETYVYRIGIASARPDFSFGAAVGLFQNIIGVVLVFLSNLLSKKVTGNGLW